VASRSSVVELTELFSKKKRNYILGLPEYQRRYTWPKRGNKSDDSVRVMAQSITKNLARKEITTFFGMIVFKDLYEGKTRKELLKMTKKESKEFMIKCNSIRRRVDLNNAKKELKEHYDLNRPVVVDGQQRLTTLLLGCGVLKKIFLEQAATTARFDGLKRDEWVGELEDICLDNGKFRFQISGEDFNHATKFCSDPLGWPKDGKWPKPGKQNGYWPIESATNNMYSVWSSWINSKTTAVKKRSALGQLANSLCNEIELVLVTVNSDLQAHIVFNALNTTGELLTKGELISSYIRLKATEFDSGTQKKAGDTIEEIIRELKADNATDTDSLSDFYLRHEMSKNGYIKMDNLFNKYEQDIQVMKKPKFNIFLDEIKSSVQNYLDVNDAKIPGHEDDLWDFKSASMKQHVPVFMAALAVELDDDDLADLFKIIRIFVARYMIAGHGTGRGRVLDTEWGRWASNLTKHKERALRTMSSSIADDIKQYINEVDTNTDTAFENCLKEAQNTLLQSATKNGPLPVGEIMMENCYLTK